MAAAVEAFALRETARANLRDARLSLAAAARGPASTLGTCTCPMGLRERGVHSAACDLRSACCVARVLLAGVLRDGVMRTYPACSACGRGLAVEGARHA